MFSLYLREIADDDERGTMCDGNAVRASGLDARAE
jgi:hypothetical protein